MMIKTTLIPSLLCVLGFSLVHLFAGRLRFIRGLPRSLWLSLSSGVAIAYVFIRLLPNIGVWQATIEGSSRAQFGFLQHHAYLVALFGMLALHGAQRFAEAGRKQEMNAPAQENTPAQDSGANATFWLHILTVAVFNVSIGYLLVNRPDSGLRSLLLFFVGMAVYLLVSDYGLRRTYGGTYERVGRWVLTAAVFGGWVLGSVMELNAGTQALLSAFIAGAPISNVITEEAKAARTGSFGALLLGAVLYTALLLAQ